MQLGATFPVKLEAPHVVDVRKQVWAGAISHGADGCMLQATYKHANTPAFQDSVGSSVVAVCRVVPDGVLMFLPSYSMLDRLMTRWKVCLCVGMCVCYFVLALHDESEKGVLCTLWSEPALLLLLVLIVDPSAHCTLQLYSLGVMVTSTCAWSLCKLSCHDVLMYPSLPSQDLESL